MEYRPPSLIGASNAFVEIKNTKITKHRQITIDYFSEYVYV